MEVLNPLLPAPFLENLPCNHTYDTPISSTVSLIKHKLPNIAEVTLYNTQTSTVLSNQVTALLGTLPWMCTRDIRALKAEFLSGPQILNPEPIFVCLDAKSVPK